MQEHVAKRIRELVTQGNSLVRSRDQESFWMKDVVQAQAWMTSAGNAIRQVSPASSVFCVELEKQLAAAAGQNGLPSKNVEKILGVLQSVQSEAEAGLLTRLEHQIIATTFDDFLDHAAEYHRSGKLAESATLASAVLEDTLKKVASKHGLNASGKSLDPLLDELAKAEVFTSVKVKRLKAHAA